VTAPAESGRSRIAAAFARARAERRAAILPYLTAGYPDPSETVDLVRALEDGGADLIEIGLPFSDPLADGPTIQAASQVALARGTTLRTVLDLTARLRNHVEVPVVYMGYINPLSRYGLEAFLRAMSEAGGDGIIVPDLPLEEASPLREAAARSGISWVSLVAPTTPTPRVKLLDESSSDFTYCVSLTGVTGVRAALGSGLPEYLARVAGVARKPFVVGFGISRPGQVASVVPPAAGVVVGSALLQAVDSGRDAADRRRIAREFVAAFRAAASGEAGESRSLS
jgi:tryptophan synthase alpha chain